MLLRRFHRAAGAGAAVGDADEVGDDDEVDDVRDEVDMSRGTPRSTRLALLEEKVEERERGEIRASWWARTSSRRTSKDEMR